jgi:DNA-binding response OmpR family regulator
MKKNEISDARKPARSPLYSETNPPRRILVVEDDDIIRRITTGALMKSGFEVDAAEDGAVAWDALQQKGYDLLVTDNNMPNVSGVDLLKKLFAARMSLPVIMVSSAMPTPELNRQPWLEIDATLAKPFTVSELLAVVKNVLLANDDAREAIAPPPSRPSQPSADYLRL